MKELLFVGILACLTCYQTAFAQITSHNLVGKWGLVNFDMQPKKANGKLTDKETETVNMMREALKSQPELMSFTFKADGSFLAEPKTDDSDQTATWKLKNNVLSLTSGKKKKTEEYSLKLLANGNLEFKALKSKVAIPVMTFEK